MNRTGGQATIELIVVFLGFAALFLGLFELTRLYQAKHALTTATFAAARAGALHHAQVGVMNAELANQMSVLLMEGGRSAPGVIEARRRAIAIVSTPGTGVRIISPTAVAATQLWRSQWVRSQGESSRNWKRVIPNDNLRWRPRGEANPPRDNSRPSLSVQDANLLRISSLWCHHLVVPGLDRVITAVVNALVVSNERQRACTLYSELPTSNGLFVAISADAVLRLQRPMTAQLGNR